MTRPETLIPLEIERITRLKREIIADYDQVCQIKKFINSETVAETDGTFIQVYFRTSIDRIWFSDLGHYPAFGSFGGAIARGEVSYFLDSLRERVKAQTLEDSTFALAWLRDVINSLPYQYNNTYLLSPIEVMYQRMVLGREWKTRYNNISKNFEVELNGLRLPIFGILKEAVRNDIIPLRGDCCRLRYKLFHFDDLDLDSTLSVEIKPYEENAAKMDILVRSTIKLDRWHPRLARIFSLESA